MNNEYETDIEKLLEALKITLPLVQRLFPIDVMFALTDTEKFIYNLPGTELDVRIQEGTPVPPNGESGLHSTREKKSVPISQRRSTGYPLSHRLCRSVTGTEGLQAYLQSESASVIRKRLAMRRMLWQ